MTDSGLVTRRRLDGLTSLRFFAALLVVVHHATSFYLPKTAYPLVSTGYIGVAFFFVLSGFVLTWSFNPDLPIRAFYGRRLARIYPMHLLTAILAVPVLLLIGARILLAPSLLNVVLLHAWVPLEQYGASLNGVSWSLSCEAFFYALFPLLVRGLRRVYNLANVAGGVGIALVAVAAVVTLLAPPAVAQQLLYKGPWFRIGEFVLGIMMALILQRGTVPRVRLRWPLLAFALSYAVTLVVNTVLRHHGLVYDRVWPDLIMLPTTCWLILTVARRDSQGRPSWLHHRWLVRLGEASFALYMVHYLLIEAAAHLSGTNHPLPVDALYAVAVIVVAVALSLVAYRLVEHPAERALRRRIGRSPDRLAATALDGPQPAAD